MGAIHSTKIPTGPTGKRGPPQKVDQFFRNFSGWTEPIHWALDRNFRKFWLNGSRPITSNRQNLLSHRWIQCHWALCIFYRQNWSPVQCKYVHIKFKFVFRAENIVVCPKGRPQWTPSCISRAYWELGRWNIRELMPSTNKRFFWFVVVFLYLNPN